MINKKFLMTASALFISALAFAQQLNYREIAYPYDNSEDVYVLMQGFSPYADVKKVDLGVFLEGDIPFWKVFTVDGLSYTISDYLGKNPNATYLIYLKEGYAALMGCSHKGIDGDFSKIGFTSIGRFEMPEQVSYDGKQYPVTKILEGSEFVLRYGGISSLVISNKVTEIGDNAFKIYTEGGYKPFLTSVVMGNSVKTIGEYAFTNQTLLTDVELSPSIENIGREAFSKTGIKSIDFKGSIKALGEGAFAYCDQLETVNMNCETDTLPKNTFLMCKNLTSVSLGNKIRVLEMYSFAGTENLTTIEFPASLESFGVSAFGQYHYTDYCGLKKLECPSGLKSIDVHAFSGCQLEEIRFNEALEEIGWQVFDVTLLKDIYCPSFLEVGKSYKYESPFVLGNYDVGDQMPSDGTKEYWDKVALHVPHDLMKKFHDTNPWSYFNVVDIETGEPYLESDVSSNVCAKPSISIDNGELIFTCETEDVEFVTSISCYDVGTLVHRGNIKLAGTYVITSYAKRKGYKNSEMTKATLSWIPRNPNEEIGISDAEISSSPVLITNNGGTLTIQGAEAGTEITVYDLTGRRLASAKAAGTVSAIDTKLKKGDTAILRIGDKSVKVMH